MATPRETPGPASRVRMALLALALAFVIAGLLSLLVTGAAHLLRGTPLRTVRSVGSAALPATPSAQLARLLEIHGRLRFDGGHRVDLLLNGDGTFPVLWADLRAATRSITAQLYYCKPGALADTLVAILSERARAGVRVLFLPDAFGCVLEDGTLERLRDAGVQAEWFRPLAWYQLDRSQQRAHSRIVVIDGAVAVTGGFGIADVWLGGSAASGEWRETNVRFTGPAVADHQATFAAAWVETTGELIVGDAFYPPADSAGNVRAAVLRSTPGIGSTPIERFMALAIAGARQRLWITNAYFVPDDDFRRLLAAAAGRGVDVRVLTAGERTDAPVVRRAGRAHYGDLLRAGVRLWEYEPTMVHAKTLVVDGVLSVIGSINFDNRSIARNEEVALVTLDSGTGAAMDSLLLGDLTRAREVTLEGWRRRSVFDRLLDRTAALLTRWL